MKILITGPNGYIARNLIKSLDIPQNSLFYISRYPTLTNFKNDRLDSENTLFYKDYYPELSEVVDFLIAKKPEVVIHLASANTVEFPIDGGIEHISSNIIFASILLESMRITTIKNILTFGSYSEYYIGEEFTHPNSFYAYTKASSKNLVDYYSISKIVNSIHLILNHVYGYDENKRLVSKVVEAALFGSSLNLDSGVQMLDFVYIDDVIGAIAIALERFNNIKTDSNASIIKEVFGIGTKVSTSVNDLIGLVTSLTSSKIEINRNVLNDKRFTFRKIYNDYNFVPGWVWKTDLTTGLKLTINVKKGNYEKQQ